MNDNKLIKRSLNSIYHPESVQNYFYEHKFGHNLRDGVSPLSGFELKKNLYGPFLWMQGSTVSNTLWFLFIDVFQLSQGYRAFTRRQFTYFSPLSPQDVLVLILSTSKG